MILNIDKNFSPFHSEKEIRFESFTFSGGEPHFKLIDQLDKVEAVKVSHRLKSFNDVGLLLIAIDALKRTGVKHIELCIPYFPAARQDRVMVKGESLSVKVYADLINQLQLDNIIVFDPHSEVTPALLDNCTAVSNFTFIEQVMAQLDKDVLLVSPDGGALKKIYKLAAHLKNFGVLECSKSRDVKTGQLSGFKVYADDLAGQDCLIVDDICDGGGTFMGLAQELKKKNAGQLYLAVSHGIFSKGFEDLSQHFAKIFTTDSFQSFENDALIQIKLNTCL